MKERLRVLLEQFCQVDDVTVRALVGAATSVSFSRLQYVIQQGDSVTDLYFLFTGLYRLACKCDNKEDTLCFITENTPMTSIHALYNGSPAALSIQTIIPGEGAAVPLVRWRQLVMDYPALSKCYERMLVKQLYDLERRVGYFANVDIDSRYSTFMKVRPNFTNQIPLKYIAQYLGVTPETISRVRARLSRKAKKS